MQVGVQDGISTEPNVVPMIDVLLVLIIIFMLLMGRYVIAVQVPARSPWSGQSEETPVLEVVTDGEYRINGGIIPPAALIDTLTALYRERPHKLLFVRGDRDRSYQDIIRAMDAAREAGVEVLGWMPNPPQ